MKKLFTILVAFLCGTIVRAQPDPISVNDVTIAKGGTKQMEVTINYAGDMTAFQFDLTLPTGFSVKDVNLNGEYGNTRHLLEGTVTAGKMRFLSYDDVNGKLTDDTKVFITLEATDEAETATMRGDGILLVEPDGSCIFQEFTSAMITIQNGAKTRMHSVGRNTFSSEVNTMLNQFATNSLTRQSDFWRGDINGDGILDGRDITALADSIIGDKQSSHLDINEDQKVNVSDLVTLVNLIAEVSPTPIPTPTPSPTPVDPTPTPSPTPVDPTPVNPTPNTTFYQGGIYYQIGENNTVSVISGEVKDAGDLIIPSKVAYNDKNYSVTSIKSGAFDSSRMTSVTIPGSITSIGAEAFCDCISLTSVHITDLDAWCRISFGYRESNPLYYAHHLFLNGAEIRDLRIPSSVTYIARQTFEYCDGLTSVEIPNSVTSIGDGAFKNCSGLISVTIPKSVTSIGELVFGGCSGLSSIKVEKGNLYYYSIDGCNAIIDISSNTLLCGCKNTIIPNNVKSIGNYAFYGCSGLTSLTIPGSLTRISDRAFQSCISLSSITIPNSVEFIGDYAFMGCTGLTSVVSEIKQPYKISDNVFSGITAELIVPKGTKALYQATEGWNKFAKITEAQSVSKNFSEYIWEAGVNNDWGTYAQPLYCANQGGIYSGFFYAQEADWSGGKGAFKFTGAFNSWDEGNYGTGTISDDGLTGTLINDGGSGNVLTTPGFYKAEVNLAEMTYKLTAITSIGIIGPAQSGGWSEDTDLTYNPKTRAFEGTLELAAGEFKFRANDTWDINWGGTLDNLTQDGSNLWITSSGTYFIQFFPLCETKSYATITELGSSSEIGSIFEYNGIYYGIGDNNTVSVTYGEVKYSGDVVIPEQVIYKGKTYSVKSIGSDAFYGCKDMTSISIPNSVTSIEPYSFEGCSGLNTIVIPNSVGYINQWAFEYCSGLTSITFLGSLTCYDNAFRGCNNLTAVHILDLETFLNNKYEIGEGPFSNPLSYAQHLFMNGEEIKDLVIPNTITKINANAFWGCSGLTSITIPNSVTSIGSSAFWGCSGLMTIVSEIEKPYIIDECFDSNVYLDAELIVPKGTKALYQATEGWNRFARITEAVDTDEALFTIDDITYQGTKSENIVVVKAVDTKQTSIEIPASVSYDGISYQVSGIADGVFDGSNMAALIWNVEAALPNNAFSNASIGSNILLYVKSADYAPSSVKNVIVDGTAQTIVLSDDGGQFYCPQAFTARRISYSHNYSMETGKGSTMGWESIALPFDVQRIIHSTQGEIVPFAAYSSGSNQKPFWLAYMSAGGFKRTADIRANEAYIIAMPNNSSYQDNYILAGDVTFSAENITVPQTPSFNGTFLPAFSFVAKSSSVYALNVNNRYVRYSGSEKPGSVFIRDLRDVRPFEAYLTGNFTRGIIEINYDNGTTDILDVLLSIDDSKEMTIHTLSGQQVSRTIQRDFNSVWQQLPKGVYVVNGKKLIK